MITQSRCERTTASRSGRPRLLLQAVAALALVAALPTSAAAQVARLPIFDAHVHFSHDAVEVLPVPEAIALLRKSGVRGALESGIRASPGP